MHGEGRGPRGTRAGNTCEKKRAIIKNNVQVAVPVLVLIALLVVVEQLERGKGCVAGGAGVRLGGDGLAGVAELVLLEPRVGREVAVAPRTDPRGVPEDVNRAQNRIASTNQHPIRIGTS